MSIRYEDLTTQQKEEICNGCGGKGSFVRPPHGVFFEASCNHHDYGYWVGCNDEHRKACDKKLLGAMLRDCKRAKWYNRLRYTPWCYAYYFSVRKFGGKFFYYSTKHRCPM